MFREIRGKKNIKGQSRYFGFQYSYLNLCISWALTPLKFNENIGNIWEERLISRWFLRRNVERDSLNSHRTLGTQLGSLPLRRCHHFQIVILLSLLVYLTLKIPNASLFLVKICAQWFYLKMKFLQSMWCQKKALFTLRCLNFWLWSSSLAYRCHKFQIRLKITSKLHFECCKQPMKLYLYCNSWKFETSSHHHHFSGVNKMEYGGYISLQNRGEQ